MSDMELPVVAAGQPAIDVIELAYRANQPVLFLGSHGVGKSELFAEAAANLGIDHKAADLSLMGPTDLVVIPHVGTDGRTHYAPPAFLPDGGRGLLVLEELGRAPRYMRTPCL